jgi:hypothetical protein
MNTRLWPALPGRGQETAGLKEGAHDGKDGAWSGWGVARTPG